MSDHGSSGQRGSALVLAVMVALVLAFLGLGLLAAATLGTEAAATGRWRAKSLAAAESGLAMTAELAKQDQLRAGAFLLADDPALPGLLRGQYRVEVVELCEVEPAQPEIGWEWPRWGRRTFHAHSRAERDAGTLVGLARAEVEADLAVWPFDLGAAVPVPACSGGRP